MIAAPLISFVVACLFWRAIGGKWGSEGACFALVVALLVALLASAIGL